MSKEAREAERRLMQRADRSLTIYQESQIKDVAKLLAEYTCPGFADTQYYGALTVQNIALSFADLFAADNPAYCSHCGLHEDEATMEASACHTPDEEHELEGGFDRKQFLADCGLESEG